MTNLRPETAVRPNDILRIVLEIFAIVSLSLWGFLGWSLPVNIVLGILLPAIAIVLWGLFRSPKAVIPLDPFGRALVEIVVMTSAAFAWWGLGQPVVAIVFAIVATASGIVNGLREFR